MYKNKDNIFSKKSKPLNLSEEFFPSLSNNKVDDPSMVEIKKNISYAEKLNCAVKEEMIMEIEPGTVVISIDKKNNIFSRYGTSTLKEKNTLNEMEEFKNNIKEMFERWENYKNTFIELYGEDEYNKQYKCPNYNYDYLNLDESDEDEEEYSDYEMIEE